MARNVVLASLDEAESDRIQKSMGSHRYLAQWRLEVFNPKTLERGEIFKEIEHYMSLLCCVYRGSPKGIVNLDEFRNGVWVRREYCGMLPGSEGYALLPLERVPRWGALIENFPRNLTRNIQIALSYFREAIAERRDWKHSKAMLSAAIAFESLLGENVKSEITFRLSQRGAILTSAGEGAELVFKTLRKLYSIRSKLVHEGKSVDKQSVVRMEQFLMRAIPSMAALVMKAGSARRAVELLERAPFVRDEILCGVSEGDPVHHWWASVNLVETPDWVIQ